MTWLTNWDYRKVVTISNTGSLLTDYQVSITIDTTTLISAGKMRSDCGDIRFTSSDGSTLLPYWVESGINTASTKIWIKSTLANGDNIVYMYYGNSSATSASNAATTFPVPTASTGGTITYDGAYAIHFFTNSETFAPSFSGEVKITAWGGGGGGGALAGWAQRGVGGAGSGEVIEDVPVNITYGTPYPVTIGAGGAGGWAGTWTGAGLGIGGNTTFSSFISVEGGKCSSFVAAANMSGGAGGGLTGAIGYPAWISTPTDYNGRMGTKSGYRTGGSSGGNCVYDYGLIGSGGNMLGLNGVTYYGGGASQSGSNYAGGGAAGYMGNGTAGTTSNGAWSASAAPNSGAGAGAGSVGVSQVVGAGNGGSGGLIVRYINRKYTSPEPTVIIGLETPPNITAKSMTITPNDTPCRTGICTISVSITWKNDEGSIGSFTPAITTSSGTVTPAYSSEQLVAYAEVTHTFTISDMIAGTCNICPNPN